METHSDSEAFERHLRAALTSLYNPSVLRDSPLAVLLGAARRRDVASALRSVLLDAIESLRPSASTPPDSKTWRVYQILRRRYTEQLTQREVAADLGLSVRQLQREEKLAREVLADFLLSAHNLAQASTAERDENDASGVGGAPVPTRAQELEWLRSSVPAQTIEVGGIIRGVLATLEPFLESSGVPVVHTELAEPVCINVQVPILRQVLLDIVGVAVDCARGGQVRIQIEALPQQVCIRISAGGGRDGAAAQEASAERLEMAEQLIRLSRGSLEVARGTAAGEAFVAQVLLPMAEQVTVLVIDDNADALQLFQRYLSGSRYRFVGAQDAGQGLALAAEVAPQIIVLDVMMPERDGWTVLGQLREHPKTSTIPVIVCTILSQEQLALTLGAAAFIRKPVARQEFLSALERQLGRPATGAG